MVVTVGFHRHFTVTSPSPYHHFNVTCTTKKHRRSDAITVCK